MQAIKSRKVFGHLEHPSDGKPDLNKAAIVITDVHMRPDGEIHGTLETLSTLPGQTASALFRDGMVVGISSRATGSLRRGPDGCDIVQNDFQPCTWDLVAEPSTPGAQLRLNEGKEDQIRMLMESYNTELQNVDVSILNRDEALAIAEVQIEKLEEEFSSTTSLYESWESRIAEIEENIGGYQSSESSLFPRVKNLKDRVIFRKRLEENSMKTKKNRSLREDIDYTPKPETYHINQGRFGQQEYGVDMAQDQNQAYDIDQDYEGEKIPPKAKGRASTPTKEEIIYEAQILKEEAKTAAKQAKQAEKKAMNAADQAMQQTNGSQNVQSEKAEVCAAKAKVAADKAVAAAKEAVSTSNPAVAKEMSQVAVEAAKEASMEADKAEMAAHGGATMQEMYEEDSPENMSSNYYKMAQDAEAKGDYKNAMMYYKKCKEYSGGMGEGGSKYEGMKDYNYEGYGNKETLYDDEDDMVVNVPPAPPETMYEPEEKLPPEKTNPVSMGNSPAMKQEGMYESFNRAKYIQQIKELKSQNRQLQETVTSLRIQCKNAEALNNEMTRIYESELVQFQADNLLKNNPNLKPFESILRKSGSISQLKESAQSFKKAILDSRTTQPRKEVAPTTETQHSTPRNSLGSLSGISLPTALEESVQKPQRCIADDRKGKESTSSSTPSRLAEHYRRKGRIQ